MTDELADAVLFSAEQPQRFLSAWLGPPRRPVQEVAAADHLPRALVHWHEQVSRWGYADVMRQNHVPDKRVIDGDVLLVGVENQSVWLWGVRGLDGNPLVIERENDDRASWTETGERLDEFLWHFTVVDAVVSAPYGCMGVDVTRPQLASFLKDLSPVEAKCWRWPAAQQALWTRGGALIHVSAQSVHPDAPVQSDSTYEVFVGARSIADLEWVDEAGLAWDWGSHPESDVR